MVCKKLFSKLLSKSLLIPVGISYFGCCTYAMENKEIGIRQRLLLEVKGQGEEESFVRSSFRDIERGIKALARRKIQESGSNMSLSNYLSSLTVDHDFRVKLIAFIDKNRIEVTNDNADFADYDIKYLNGECIGGEDNALALLKDLVVNVLKNEELHY